MSRIICIASQKGGVGKTTTTLNLSYSMSRFGDRVLLIDADPQGGMSLASNVRRKSRAGLVQLLRDGLETGEALVETRDRMMTVVGSGIDDPRDALYLEEAALDGRLSQLLTSLRGRFDLVVADAPAGVGSIVHALLRATDGIILPLRCQAAMLKSLPMMLRLVREVQQDSNPSLRVDGAVVTMWDERSEQQEQLRRAFVAQLPPNLVFGTMIPDDESFEEASRRGVPVALVAEGGSAARAYLDLAMELRDRRGKGGDSDGSQDLF